MTTHNVTRYAVITGLQVTAIVHRTWLCSALQQVSDRKSTRWPTRTAPVEVGLNIRWAAEVLAFNHAPAPPHTTVYSPRYEHGIALGASGDKRLIFAIFCRWPADDRINAYGCGDWTTIQRTNSMKRQKCIIISFSLDRLRTDSLAVAMALIHNDAWGNIHYSLSLVPIRCK